jgi:hypothetical protein
MMSDLSKNQDSATADKKRKEKCYLGHLTDVKCQLKECQRNIEFLQEQQTQIANFLYKIYACIKNPEHIEYSENPPKDKKKKVKKEKEKQQMIKSNDRPIIQPATSCMTLIGEENQGPDDEPVLRPPIIVMDKICKRLQNREIGVFRNDRNK